MKISIALICLMSLLCPNAYAQAIGPVVVKSIDPASAQADILGILKQIKVNIDDPLKANSLIHELEAKSDYYVNFKVPFTQEHWREVAIESIKIFDSLGTDYTGTNFANKVRMVEFIGGHGNSQEAHQFFIKHLDTDNKDFRRHVLRAIAGRGGLEGDDIYDKVKELVRKGMVGEGEALRYLKEANRNRALKEIQDFIVKTNDLDEYITAGIFLCDYKDPKVIEVLLARYPDFKTKPRNSFGDNPAFAFSDEVIRQYIELHEGQKLQQALDVLSDEDISGNRDLALWEKKLKSHDAVTRRAVVVFMLARVKPGYASKDKVLPVLREAAARESDAALKKKILDGIKSLEQRK